MPCEKHGAPNPRLACPECNREDLERFGGVRTGSGRTLAEVWALEAGTGEYLARAAALRDRKNVQRRERLRRDFGDWEAERWLTWH